MSGNKDGGDSEEVVCKLTRSVFGFCVAVNHEFCASFFQDEADQLQSIPTESVFVHNHNLCDTSCVYAFQKGLQTPAFEVEARCDVGNNFVAWVRGLEVLHLSLQVTARFLRTGADPGVDDADFRLDLLPMLLDAKMVLNGCFGVQSLPGVAILECGDDATGGPLSQGGSGDGVLLAYILGSDEDIAICAYHAWWRCVLCGCSKVNRQSVWVCSQ